MSLVITPARKIAIALAVAAASISLGLVGAGAVDAGDSGSLNQPLAKSISLN